ncbi:MAG: CtsR family transcriptional regulator [Tindallia sp. MSAO_Bac2]|nr:MAG: CtsR family transcriptional regulator [Tindallia sp. MSAO_Bac2]
MASVSDVIEKFFKELLEQNQGKTIQIQRNEVAKYFDCSPSQINYVLMTRFSVQHGYYIESQRGGGGHIKITMLKSENNKPAYHLLMNEIGDEITKTQAHRIINALKEQKYISEREALIMKAAMEDSALLSPLNNRDQLRAQLLKGMISVLFH